MIAKSIATGNVANDGGGLFFNVAPTTLPSTPVKGNSALVNQSIGSV